MKQEEEKSKIEINLKNVLILVIFISIISSILCYTLISHFYLPKIDNIELERNFILKNTFNSEVNNTPEIIEKIKSNFSIYSAENTNFEKQISKSKIESYNSFLSSVMIWLAISTIIITLGAILAGFILYKNIHELNQKIDEKIKKQIDYFKYQIDKKNSEDLKAFDRQFAELEDKIRKEREREIKYFVMNYLQEFKISILEGKYRDISLDDKNPEEISEKESDRNSEKRDQFAEDN